MTGAAATPILLERGDGVAEIGLVAGPGGARIAELYQRTPLRLLFPNPETGDVFMAALVTTSGGLAGGDKLAFRATLGTSARAVVASQAAEKVYRSTGDVTAFDVSLEVGRDAWLEWLPQETILFDGARLRRRFALSVAPEGRLLACDAFVLGRRARGEVFTRGLLQDRWEIRRGGELVWADAFRLDDPLSVAHPAGFGGAAAVGFVLFVGPEPEAALAIMRRVVDDLPRAGATLVGGVAILRVLESDPARLKRSLGEAVMALRADIGGLPRAMPKLWQC